MIKKVLWAASMLLLSSIMMIESKAEGTTDQKTFTPEVMMQLYRIASPQLSPDGTRYLYTRSLPNLADNKITTEIVVGTLGQPGVRYPLNVKGHSPIFLDANTIAYVDTSGDNAQVALVGVDGTNQKVLSDFPFPVTGFLFSPDRTKIVIIRDVELPKIAEQENPDLDKITGRIYDDLMYKHWDHWVMHAPQPFLSSVSEDFTVGNELLPILGEGVYFEAPILPFGGTEQFTWSPDGKSIAYSSKKKVGIEYAVSTNTDIYVYDIPTGETTNISEGMMGYDTDPKYSHNGQFIAWLSMERDGYEADLPRLFIQNVSSGQKVELSKEYEYYIEHFEWTPDDRAIRFCANDRGVKQIFEIDLGSLRVKQLTGHDMADVTSFASNDKLLLFGLQSFKFPTDLYLMDLQGKGAKQTTEITKLTNENDTLLADLPNIEVQRRWITTTDGKQMLTWVVLPPNFDPNKKYPAILYCQGGPQGALSQFWSYRWNFRTFASHGYIMVAPNRRGVNGHGKEWQEQISGDWGGQNMRDYLTAIDAVAREPYVDETRLGATGASYGGFSVYWLAGNHQGRFKSFAAHAGIFNLEAQYLETEEKFFANWDMGGAFWLENNPIAQHTYANSPHRFVQNWDTPILITHGDKDYRILSSQGFQAFDAAKMQGIPARVLFFPDENHWILKPQNGVLFYRTWFDWMDRWLK